MKLVGGLFLFTVLLALGLVVSDHEATSQNFKGSDTLLYSPGSAATETLTLCISGTYSPALGVTRTELQCPDGFTIDCEASYSFKRHFPGKGWDSQAIPMAAGETFTNVGAVDSLELTGLSAAVYCYVWYF